MAEAESLLWRALDINEVRLRSQCIPTVATNLNNLAELLRVNSGLRLAEAEFLCCGAPWTIR